MSGTSIVVDCGSAFHKAGFAGDDAPRSVFPPVVGRASNPQGIRGAEKDPYIGDEARVTQPVLNVNPNQSNKDVEKILHHTFYNELRIQPEEFPVLLTDHALAAKEDREKKAEILFEHFKTPAVYVEMGALLSMYASGEMTGVFVDLGHTHSEIVPINYCVVVSDAVKRFDIAGAYLTKYLTELMNDRAKTETQFQFTTTCERKIVCEIKEKLCYVASDFHQEIKNNSASLESYKLPSGETITIASERFRSPELLFQPLLAGVSGPGIHQMIVNAITECPDDTHKDLSANIILSGGTSMIPGFADRLQAELTPPSKVVSPPDREYSAWTGGSILASLPTFKDMWITKQRRIWTNYFT